MNKKTLIIVAAISILVLVASLFFLQKKNSPDKADENRGVAGKAITVAMDYYEEWLNAKTSAEANPYVDTVINSMAVSTELSQRLAETETTYRETVADPVLCQSEASGSYKARRIFETDDAAQIMVLAKNDETVAQTIFTLAANGDLWKITNIECGNSEEDPNQGEYSFENEGFLLKDSLQPPLNNQQWHLVFEQDGTPGYTVPLSFSSESLCTLGDSSESVCDESQLYEALRVTVKGDMTEAGLNVKVVEKVE